MNEKNIWELQKMLEKLGFSGRTAWQLESYRSTGALSFHLFYGRSVGEDFLLYGLEFQRSKAGNYALTGYTLSLTRIEIPNVRIRDIEALVLEQNLKQVDKYYDFFLSENWTDKITKEDYGRVTGYMEATNAALERLASWSDGEEVAKLLMFKYWPEVRYTQHFSDYTSLERRHRVVQYFPVNPKNIITANQSYQQLKSSFMNEKNFEYLTDNLRYMGFGVGLAEALKEQMKAGAPAFHLSFDAEINKKAFSAVLSFRKSENTGMYFFNSYHATLRRSNGEVKDQTFYLNKGKGVTAKEAFNLLEGRAVYRELENKAGEKYHAWLQIDFGKRDKNNNHEMKQYHEAYGYELKGVLARFPIRDMKEPDLRDLLLSSLQKGNLQAVAVEKEGSTVRMFVEAAPQFKSINLYDSDLKRVPKEELQLCAGKTHGTEGENKEKLENGKENKQKNGSLVEKPKPKQEKSAKRSIGH